jgi:deoxyribodipyrimidine photo-lyase
MRLLADGDVSGGRFVLYWMQQSQRASQNPALELAVAEANARELPVVVVFALIADYPEANARHFAFMLQGLAEVGGALAERGIPFVVRTGEPTDVVAEVAGEAALVVCDRGYLRHQKRWRRELARSVRCPLVQVEGDVVVPVDEASDKLEYAARTLRPKLRKLIDRYLVNRTERTADNANLCRDIASDVDLDAVETTLRRLGVDDSVAPVRRFQGGTTEARRRLTSFLRYGLPDYDAQSRDPAENVVSTLSPYLHFGQIAPVEIALKVGRATGGSAEDREAFLEELIVRRELAINFVHRCADYDSFRSLPEWARATLAEHADDEREVVYTRRQLEAAETHDPYWNAAMTEMVATGYMHNHMRMYWAKKILEWTNTPEYGFRTTLGLNNRYFLDGRDPSSFANVAWCYGLHDRPWSERKIFGKVRYMNARGLERKFDMDRYRARVDELAAAESD